MSEIHIQRPHQLGYARARQVAAEWAEGLAEKLGVELTTVPGDGDEERIEFARSGVKGALTVAPDQFVFDAKLGMLLGAFSKKIEAEVEASLDALAAGRGPRTAVVRGDG